MEGSERVLRLRPGFMMIPGDDILHIRSLRRVLMLRGRASATLVPRILAALDGSRTIGEVAHALGQPEEVLEIVSLLERADLLQDFRKQDGALGGLLALLDSLGTNPETATEQLRSHRFGVLASPTLQGYIRACFAAYGVDSVRTLPDPVALSEAFVADLKRAVDATTVFVAALDRWQPPLLRLVNEVCVHAGRPWIALQPENECNLLIGPFVLPGETACYACLERRRRANRLDEGEVEVALDHLVDSCPTAAHYLDRAVAPLYEPAIAMTVTEAVKYAAGLDFYLSTLNQVVSFTPFMLQTESIPVFKLPRCPVCSRVAQTQSPRVWMGE